MALILDAQNICKQIETRILSNLKTLPKLCLASVAIGEDFSVGVYQSSQEQTAKELGIEYKPVNLPANVTFDNFKEKVNELNSNPQITGIILNKPFSFNRFEEEVFSLIDIKKDVEGVHPANLGKLFLNPHAVSPTVKSILELTGEALKEDTYRGKKITVVGFSSLIGQPLTIILGSLYATVSVAHIGTYEAGDLENYVKNADIVISAVGKPNLIKGDWIKQGAIVIDVGTGKLDGKQTGDVEFDKAKERAAVITPVPGGVGKLTTMCLFDNLVNLAKK